MKTFSVLAIGVFVGLCAATRADAAAQNGRENDRGRSDQICVYKDINFQGPVECYNAGDELNTLGAQNRSISSIRIYGHATVIVYEGTEFRGHSAQFTSDVSDLGRRMMQGNTSWSDHIDSLRVGGPTELTRSAPPMSTNATTDANRHRRRGTACAFMTARTMRGARHAGTWDRMFPISQGRATGADRSRPSAFLAAPSLWFIRTPDTEAKV